MRKSFKKAVGVLSVATMLIAGLTFTGCGSEDSKEFSTDKTISVVSREPGSGTRGAFIELLGIEEKDDEGNKKDRTYEEAIIASKTDIMLTNVSSDMYAIGYVSVGSLNESVKAVKIDGAEPTVENIKSGKYKIARPFNIATKGEVSEVAKDFIDYILSAEGQKVVEAAGYIEAVSGATAYTAKEGTSGKIVVAGSSSVSPVMEKLKEAYLKLNASVTIEIQTNDSSAGMKAAIDGTCDIGMASRDLKDSEKAELDNTEIAIDGIAIVVNPKNAVSELSTEQAKKVFIGELTKWTLK